MGCNGPGNTQTNLLNLTTTDSEQSAFYGKPKPDNERHAILDKLYADGELFWDSADVYGDSEDLLGKSTIH